MRFEHTGAQPAAHRVQQVLDRLLHERVAVARSNGAKHDLFPVAIPAAEGEALRDWVRRENATRTIEVGLGYGIAALFICAGLLDNGAAAVRHVVIDPYQTTRFADCAIQFLDEAGVAGLVECHREGSEIVLPQLLSRGSRFDLAFVDGNHRFDGVFLDLVFLGRLVEAGGIVFVDDYQLPGVYRAVSFCASNLGWTVEDVSAVDDLHHWAVLRTARTAPDRSFDHYVDF